MIYTSKVVLQNPSGEFELKPYPIEKMIFPFPAILSIDGSTDITGFSILRLSDAAVCGTLAFHREKDKETPVAFKVRMKRITDAFLKQNSLIKYIFTEEPFFQYINAAKNLFMLRSFIEEIIVENEPELNYLKWVEVPNKTWKSLFLYPDSIPVGGTDAEKEAVRKKLVAALPFMAGLTQDEIDSTAMGMAAIAKMKLGEVDELKAKKKYAAFLYQIDFYGANDDESAIDEIYSLGMIPERPASNGIVMRHLKGTGKFEKYIYQYMEGEDKVLILRFPSNKHADVVTKYRIADLATSYPFIYALIWRKNRK